MTSRTSPACTLIAQMPITLPPETTKKLQASIRRYAAEHLDEEMGDRAGRGKV